MPRGAIVGDAQVVRIESADFHRLYMASKEFAPDLAKELRKAIRRAGGPIVRDIRSAIDEIPSSGRYRTGVRAALKAGTRVSISTSRTGAGAKFVTNPSRLPAAKRSLAKAMNKAAFRHPVLGNREAWVEQAGHPYFGSTIYDHANEVRTSIAAAIQDAADRLAERTS